MPKRVRNSSDSDKLERKKRKLIRKLEEIKRRERRVVHSPSTSEYSSESDSEGRQEYVEPEVIINIPDGDSLESGQAEQQPEVNSEILQLLGEVPSGKDQVFGGDVHAALAERWTKYLALGMEKVEKEGFKKKYLIPKNIMNLRAPLLNPELETSLKEESKKEDKYVATIQNQVGIALAAIAGVIDKVLTDDKTPTDPPIDMKSQVLPHIVDAGKILCDAFHMMSTNRKYHVETHVNRTVKKLIKESYPDEYLCGKNFADKFKEVRTQWRTGREMKNSYSSSKYPPSTSHGTSVNKPQKMPETVPSQSLNYQPLYHKGRMKVRPQRRERQYARERPYKKSDRKNNYPN